MYEGKKIDVSGWWNSDEKFKEMANLWKKPVSYWKWRYDNINEKLKKDKKLKKENRLLYKKINENIK